MNNTTKRDEEMRIAVWTVNGEDHKMKLNTFAVTQLEEQIGINLISVVRGGLPKLKTMLQITCEGLKAYDNKMTLKKTYALFDEYVENGGSQTEFLDGPFVDLYKVSGFFPKKKKVSNAQKDIEENTKENTEENIEENQ